MQSHAGQRVQLMNRKTVKRLCFVIAMAFAMVVICYGTIRVYLAQQSRRAGEILHDLALVRLDDSEASVLPLYQKHDGHRQVPTLPGNINKEYEEPDYEYLFEVDPWRINELAGHTSKLDSAIRAATTTISPRLRRAMGLRRWRVAGYIGFKQTRVIAVTASALVEGSDEWLGGVWRLLGTIPDQEIQHFVIQPGISWPEMNHYVVGWTHPNVSKADGAGEAVEIWMTPSATQQEKQSATQFMLQCLTSRSGCRTVCDFVPAALEYARSGIGTERKEACSVPRPYGYREQ